MMQTVSSRIVIEDASEQPNQVQQGSAIQRQIKVKNLGNQLTELDLWIAPTDNQSELLWKWCTFSETNPLRVPPYEARAVTLTFDIPPQANLGTYGYEILAETRFPTAGQLIRRSQQLRIVRSDDLERESIPRFVVQPTTHSTQPLEISVGEPQSLTVQVENRSRRVDRFYLICPDLDPTWITIQYPESHPDIPGLVTETDGLELNPGEAATIQILLHPPIHAPADTYFPTLRLISTIRDDLVLLDVVYLKILPHDQMAADLHPARQRIPEDAGTFEVRLVNQGNRQRQVALLAYDADRLFDYVSEPGTASLLPGEQSSLTLMAKPRKWWRRPWWGKGLEITFDLGLDQADVSAAYALPATLPQGTLIWQPRPFWQLGLLLLLTLGTLGAIAFALWYTFFKPDAPPPVPEVTAFAATEPNYQEGGSPIRLNWAIRPFSGLQKVVLIRLDEGVETYRKSYAFSPGAAQLLPTELRPQPNQASGCEVLSTPLQADQLRCQAIATPAAPTGNYVFKLQVFSVHHPDEPVTVALTDSIAIAPPEPAPAIATFTSTHPAYTTAAAPTDTALATEPILLNWAIAQPNQIQALQIVGVAADGSIQSPAQTYSFEQGIPPALRAFCTMAATLQCRNVPTRELGVGLYTFQLAVIPRQSDRDPITRTTATIPITAPVPQISYFRVNDQDVATKPKQLFAIAPLPNPDTGTDTDANVDADTNANSGSDAEITLSWQVAPGEGLTAEILPAPGLVPLEGTMPYPLSASPRRETITLRVTNASGEQVSQTVVIETARPPQPAPPAPARPLSPDPPIDPNADPDADPTMDWLLPFVLEYFAPIEIPPQPD
ncbi:MAG: hypothetical protein VKK04_17855 [Synechococcales bacterium]|nr:hypothetical protein [Synechococcales bacterium]